MVVIQAQESMEISEKEWREGTKLQMKIFGIVLDQFFH